MNREGVNLTDFWTDTSPNRHTKFKAKRPHSSSSARFSSFGLTFDKVLQRIHTLMQYTHDHHTLTLW